ncbi:hypothetical protein CNEO2_350052 [Clostridium neonatale]|nr:hypothetical protein CNEO2_350052 [Clostridium neonatale]
MYLLVLQIIKYLKSTYKYPNIPLLLTVTINDILCIGINYEGVFGRDSRGRSLPFILE